MNLHYNNHLTIGFAGKRKHDKLTIVERCLTNLFTALDKSLPDTDIHLMTGLADGADQIAAKAFLNVFKKDASTNRRTIGAVIPFAKDDYLLTLSDQVAFEEIYDHHCEQRIELDGKYLKGNSGKPLSVKNKAYQQQGLVLAHTCDVLLAVAPYEKPNKMGGTIETLISVLALKKPVLLLNLNDGKFYLFNTLEDWFNQPKAIDIAAVVYTLFTQLTKEKSLKLENIHEGFIFKMRKKSWIWYERNFKGKKGKKEWPQPLVYNSLHQTVCSAMDVLDKKAIHFQYQYRGGYILNYLLALFAIFFAVFSLVILLLEKNFKETAEAAEIAHILLGIVGACKLTTLLLIISNTRELNKSGYNKKAIDYRYATERLRVNSFMAILGILRSPRPSLGNHSKKHFAQYTGETIYQSQMSMPLQQDYKMVIKEDDLKNYLGIFKKEWINDQKEYHRGEAGRMKKMENILEKIPEKLSWAVVVIVIIDLLFGLTLILKEKDSHSTYLEIIEFSIPVLLGLSAFLPAIITTLNSINFQSEAHRLATRSRLMLQALEQQEQKINEVIDKVNLNTDGSSFYEVLKVTDETANLLTDEVAEWSLIYEKRVYEG